MKPSTGKATRSYTQLLLVLTIAYWIWAFMDDYVLISAHWREAWHIYLLVWGFYYVLGVAVFTIVYWGIVWAVASAKRRT